MSEYNPPANASLGVSLFAESYGGKYGPVFAETWDEQNAKRRNGSLANSTLDIRLTALGIVSGCVDDLIQAPYLTEMMVNNSYGLQLLSPVAAGLANGSFYAPDGCRDKIAACHNITRSLHPKNHRETNNPAADTTCFDAQVAQYRRQAQAPEQGYHHQRRGENDQQIGKHRYLRTGGARGGTA